MNIDIRILTNFKGHRKRKRLKMILGHDGTGYLIDLWLTVATDVPSGVLAGWDEVDIAIAAGWENEPEIIVNALLKTGFLEKNDSGTYLIHDWENNNAYAAHAEDRSEQARKAALARWGKKKEEPEHSGQDANKCSEHSNEHKEAMPDSNLSNAPSPAPSPTPSPTPKEEKIVTGKPETPPCPHQEIISLYHETNPDLPRVEKWTEERQKHLRKSWNDKNRQSLEWWREYFLKVQKTPFLHGSNDRKWRADLEWLTTESRLVKVLEGKYDNSANTPSSAPSRKYEVNVKCKCCGEVSLERDIVGGLCLKCQTGSNKEGQGRVNSLVNKALFSRGEARL